MSGEIINIVVSSISALATTAMVFLTYKTIKQNKEQLNLMQQQWLEDRKGILSFSIVVMNNMVMLKMSNIGKSAITNIQLKFNEDFLNSLNYLPPLRSRFEEIEKRLICLEAQSSNYYMLAYTITKCKESTSIKIGGIECREKMADWIKSFRSMPIIITGTYNNSDIISESLVYENFITPSIDFDDSVAGALRDLNCLIKSNNLVSKGVSVQHSLHRIATLLERIDKDLQIPTDTIESENENAMVIEEKVKNQT